MNKTILYSKDGAIVWITLNRPEALNALNYEMVEELEEVLSRVEEDQEVRVIVLIGQGEKSFVAGSDIKELRGRNTLSGWLNSQKRQKMLSWLDNLGKPTIAAVNGYAFGVGCEIACSCTLRIASEKASFGQLEINLGIIPGAGGTQRLPRLIGKGRALELLLTGNAIDAQEAFRVGLVNQVVPHDLLRIEVKKLAESISEKSPYALKFILEAVNKGLETTLENGFKIESNLFGLILSSQDAKEGLTAFIEKRKPNFKGR